MSIKTMDLCFCLQSHNHEYLLSVETLPCGSHNIMAYNAFDKTGNDHVSGHRKVNCLLE